MHPTLKTGEQVVVDHWFPFKKLRSGMIIIVGDRDGKRVIHRLVDRTRHGWRTQGDNNRTIDKLYTTRYNFKGLVLTNKQ